MRRPISFSGNQVSFGTPGPEIRGRVAGWRDGFFVLDKWQVSRKLTLNYGLRYELPTVPYTINGNASFLNADQTALIVAEPGTGFIKPQHKNWAPRLGFAYRITEKTVFRGGAGIYYNPEPDQQLHVPQHQSAVGDHFQLQLVQRSTHPQPVEPIRRLRRVSRCRAATASGLIVTPPGTRPPAE